MILFQFLSTHTHFTTLIVMFIQVCVCVCVFALLTISDKPRLLFHHKLQICLGTSAPQLSEAIEARRMAIFGCFVASALFLPFHIFFLCPLLPVSASAGGDQKNLSIAQEALQIEEGILEAAGTAIALALGTECCCCFCCWCGCIIRHQTSVCNCDQCLCCPVCAHISRDAHFSLSFFFFIETGHWTAVCSAVVQLSATVELI